MTTLVILLEYCYSWFEVPTLLWRSSRELIECSAIKVFLFEILKIHSDHAFDVFCPLKHAQILWWKLWNFQISFSEKFVIIYIIKLL